MFPLVSPHIGLTFVREASVPRSPLALLPFTLLIVAASVRAQTHPLPKTEEIIDSVGFAAVVRAQAAGAAGKVLLSITIDSAGRVVGAWPVETRAPAEVATMLADSVIAYMRPQAPWARGFWWLRLAVRLGAQPSLRVERPRVQGPEPVAGGLADALRALGPLAPSGKGEIRLLVDETGRVRRAEAGVGTPALSPVAVARLLDQAHYTPGTVDGRPAPMWVALRIESRMIAVPVRR